MFSQILFLSREGHNRIFIYYSAIHNRSCQPFNIQSSSSEEELQFVAVFSFIFYIPQTQEPNSLAYGALHLRSYSHFISKGFTLLLHPPLPNNFVMGR